MTIFDQRPFCACADGPTDADAMRGTVAGGPRSIVAIAEDAALRAELAAQTRLAAELAHRNRNLLTVLSTLVRRTLADAADLETARAALDDIGRRMAESHDTALSTTPRGLPALAERTLAGFQAGATPQIATAGPPVALEPDAERLLALAFFELASNAVKHGALRHAAGRVTLSWQAVAGGALAIVWEEKGQTEPRALARSGGGSALLASIGADLGGPVNVTMRLEGLRVEIAVPARHLLDRRADGPRRALVVEDNPLIGGDLAEMLRDLGVRDVSLALDVREASAALAAGTFDLVMLDVTLGEDSSETLLPRLQGTSVVVVSGRSASELPASFAGLPLLPKPFQPDELAAVLASLQPGQAA